MSPIHASQQRALFGWVERCTPTFVSSPTASRCIEHQYLHVKTWARLRGIKVFENLQLSFIQTGDPGKVLVIFAIWLRVSLWTLHGVLLPSFCIGAGFKFSDVCRSTFLITNVAPRKSSPATYYFKNYLFVISVTSGKYLFTLVTIFLHFM